MMLAVALVEFFQQKKSETKWHHFVNKIVIPVPTCTFLMAQTLWPLRRSQHGKIIARIGTRDLPSIVPRWIFPYDATQLQTRCGRQDKITQPLPQAFLFKGLILVPMIARITRSFEIFAVARWNKLSTSMGFSKMPLDVLLSLAQLLTLNYPASQYLKGIRMIRLLFSLWNRCVTL